MQRILALQRQPYRSPVQGRRFHYHQTHPMRVQPRCQMLQITPVGGKLPLFPRLLRVVLIYDHYSQHLLVDINAGHNQLRFHTSLPFCRKVGTERWYFNEMHSLVLAPPWRACRTLTSASVRSWSNSLSASTAPMTSRPRVRHPHSSP